MHIQFKVGPSLEQAQRECGKHALAPEAKSAPSFSRDANLDRSRLANPNVHEGRLLVCSREPDGASYYGAGIAKQHWE
jgi:hypothetical protein